MEIENLETKLNSEKPKLKKILILKVCKKVNEKAASVSGCYHARSLVATIPGHWLLPYLVAGFEPMLFVNQRLWQLAKLF